MPRARGSASPPPRSTPSRRPTPSRYAAALGYDAVEVMVGIDAAEPADLARSSSSPSTTTIPICAVHAPCLLFTQRVWGTEPWGKLERSAEMAARGRRRGRRRAPAVPLAEGLRRATSSTGIAALEESTGIAFAVENMYPWRASSTRGMEMYLPGWDPSEEPYANTTIDLSHAAIAHSDPIEMAERLGDRLRHIHLTDGTGSAKDEHLVPGRGVDGRRAVPASTSPATGFDGEIVRRDQHPQVPRPRRARGRPARVAGVRPRALRRTRREPAVTSAAPPPRPPSRRRRTPGPPSWRAARALFAANGLRRYVGPRGRRGGRRRRRAGAPLLRHQGRPLPRRARAARRPAASALAAGRRGRARRRRRAADAAASSRSGTTSRPGCPLLALVRGILDPGGQQLVQRRLPPDGARPGRRRARDRRARPPPAAGRLPADRAGDAALRARASSPSPRCPPTSWSPSTPPRCSGTWPVRCRRASGYPVHRVLMRLSAVAEAVAFFAAAVWGFGADRSARVGGGRVAAPPPPVRWRELWLGGGAA